MTDEGAKKLTCSPNDEHHVAVCTSHLPCLASGRVGKDGGGWPWRLPHGDLQKFWVSGGLLVLETPPLCRYESSTVEIPTNLSSLALRRRWKENAETKVQHEVHVQ